MDCPNLVNCGFIKKYGESKSLAVKGFISMYCKSVKQDECKRKEYKKINGNPPVDEMLPNGIMMKAK